MLLVQTVTSVDLIYVIINKMLRVKVAKGAFTSQSFSWNLLESAVSVQGLLGQRHLIIWNKICVEMNTQKQLKKNGIMNRPLGNF